MVFPGPGVSACKGWLSLSLPYRNIRTGLGGIHTYTFHCDAGWEDRFYQNLLHVPLLDISGRIVPATPKVAAGHMGCDERGKSILVAPVQFRFSSCVPSAHSPGMDALCSITQLISRKFEWDWTPGCTAVYWSPARVCSTGHYAGPRHWASFQSIWIFWALADVIPFFSRFKYTMLPVAFLPSVFLLVFLRSPLNPLLWWWENAPQGLLLLFFFQLLQTLFMALQHSRFFSFWLLPPELYVVQYHSHPCVWRNSANFSYSVLHYSVSTSC